MRHRIAPVIIGIATVSLLPAALRGQALSRPGTGPINERYGPVFDVPGMDVPVDTMREYRAVFDVAMYRQRYGVDNPNRDLIDQLRAAGVEIVLCGQTAMSRGLPRRN